MPAYKGPILNCTRAITFLSSQVRNAALSITFKKPGKKTISRKVREVIILRMMLMIS
jgi:hypothetical protein